MRLYRYIIVPHVWKKQKTKKQLNKLAASFPWPGSLNIYKLEQNNTAFSLVQTVYVFYYGV